MKKQKSLINDSTDAFKTMLSKINLLKAVHKLLGLDKLSSGDREMMALEDKSEPLLGSGSNIVYLGGSILASEEFTLKRLLFRCTRGKAVLSTFPLEVEDKDVL